MLAWPAPPLLRQHHVAGLDNHRHLVARRDAQILNRPEGNHRGDDIAAPDVDLHDAVNGAGIDVDNLAFEDIAGTELHLILRSASIPDPHCRAVVARTYQGGSLQRDVVTARGACKSLKLLRQWAIDSALGGGIAVSAPDMPHAEV